MPNRMENMASKVAGKTKAAKATIKGLKGIFKKLAEEHGEVSALLKRVEMSSDPDVRAELFPTIKKELLAHEKGEISELYPLLRKHAETRAMADDHDGEADEMEALLEKLDDDKYDGKQWKQSFERLVELVQHHAKEEENEYFPKAQEVLGEERAEVLEKKYLSTKKSVMKDL